MAPSCKLELARFSAKLRIQDGAECGKKVRILYMKFCSDVHTMMGTLQIKMCSDVVNEVGTPHKFLRKTLIQWDGWVGGG